MSTLIFMTMIVQWIIFVAIAVLSYWLVKEIKRMENDYVRWDNFKHNTDNHCGLILMADSKRWNKEVTKGEIK